MTMNAMQMDQNDFYQAHAVATQTGNGTRMVVMFVDICGSTRMFADYGNELALAKTSRCLRKMVAIIKSRSGTIVNTFGDGVLCTFTMPEMAFHAALDIQNAARDQQIAIHGGVHSGTVITLEDSIYGDAVNVASRLADLAKKEEILLSKEVMTLLSPELQNQVRPLGELTLKGKTLPMEVYLLSSQQGSQTAYHNVFTLPQGQQELKLELTYQGTVIQLKASSSEITIGRANESHLVIDSDYTSRHHATIECRRGAFFLIDHSSNGSYLMDDKKRTVKVKREMHQLHGSGVISLGTEPKGNQTYLIAYRVIAD